VSEKPVIGRRWTRGDGWSWRHGDRPPPSYVGMLAHIRHCRCTAQLGPRAQSLCPDQPGL